MFKVQPTPRLVPAPVFILSAPRSGSTLLRDILGSHSRVHATTELALTELGVEFLRFPARYGMHTVYTELAFGEAGLTATELEYLLWDRVLHRELAASGKSVLVHKAPRVLLRWHRLAECWPQARFVFLLRHPMSIADGMRTMKNRTTWWEVADFVLRFLYQLREARAELPGLTVRYEELTENPAAVCQGICDFLGVDWEPSMLDYGTADRGPRALGFGDMGPKVASGRIQPGRPLTAAADVPSVFRPICADLGY